MSESTDCFGSHKGGCGRLAVLLLGVLAMLAAVNPPTATADAPPPYEGMAFPEIHGSADPEAFSWTVHLAPYEILVQIDDQHAAIEWDDHTVAQVFSAEPAHDIEGANGTHQRCRL
ncbi:MAG: hypothetical protein ACOYD4_08545 [Solirubrobacterales bacterium]